MRRFSPNGLIVFAAAFAALILTVVRPSPQGLFSFGLGDREVRAAPGQTAVAAAKHDLGALDVFNLTLVRIRDAYVDPARIDPKKMLYAALDSVQFNIPEVLVEASPERDEVVIVVNDKKESFSTSDVDSAWRLSTKLKKMFRFIEAHMNPGADLAKVEYAAVNGMLTTLDPHSVLLEPETAREMDVNTSGKFGGLGIVIRMHKRKLTVIRPIEGTPAFEAGIKRGDHIVKIDQEVTEHLTLSEAVDRMRGAPSTPVTLWIQREGNKDLLRFDLSRAVIRVESVEYRMLSGDVGYIRLKQFSGGTSQEVKDAMDELRSQGAKGWVLDLRWNPGGLLEQAIQVSDLFLDKGTIVTTVGGRERDPRRAERKGTDYLPVAVLVNSSSASASEIVAGALKNLDRALIIGTSTFGKGSVQVLYDNNDGSKLKLTIAQYLTPGDRSIQSLGIVPDVALHRMHVPKKNDSPTDYLRLLPPSRTYGEKDLESHLTSRYATGDDKPDYKLSFLYESPKNREPLADEDAEDAALPSDEEEPLDEEFVEDFEIKLARDVVKATGVNTRSTMIKQAKSLLAKRQEEQHDKLAAALAGIGVDWRDPPNAKEPAPALDARVTSDKARYNAGDTVLLTGTITNHGSGPAYQVHARIKSDHHVFEDTEMAFGYIAPGETRTFSTKVKLPEEAVDRMDKLDFTVSEARGVKAEVTPLVLRVVAKDRPVFAYTHQLIDSGNGDGLVQPGEEHHLRVTVKNIGKGEATEPSAFLRNASGDDIVVKKARFELSQLKPGESTTLDFIFSVSKSPRASEMVVEMTVYDAVLHESVAEKLRYPVQPASAGPAEASGYVKIIRDNTAIYEGASAQSGRIASAARGASFKVTGRQGSWYRLELSPGRPGFAAATDVQKASSAAGNGELAANWQVTPPSIKLDSPTYATSGPNYKLSGRATDDTHVEDVYIFVSNMADKVENKKVFYKSNRAGKRGNTLDFSTEIPLWPGTNRVTVVARENDKVETLHTMYVLRTSDAATISASVAP